MELYLMRHGDAVNAAVDIKRPLSDAGKADIKEVAKYLKEKQVNVSEMWHSELLRATQTAEIIAEELGVRDKMKEQGGFYPDAAVKAAARQIDKYFKLNNQNLMIVTHLPLVEDLVAFLVTGETKESVVQFSTGTVACLEKAGESRWSLQWKTSPAEL